MLLALPPLHTTISFLVNTRNSIPPSPYSTELTLGFASITGFTSASLVERSPTFLRSGAPREHPPRQEEVPSESGRVRGCAQRANSCVLVGARPLSPPAEDATTCSPTFSSSSSVLTPPDSPQTSLSLSLSPPPFNSPLPPLSGELFRLTLAFLAPSPPELEALLLVSHAWYTFIVSQPQMWTHLHYRLDQDHIARARTW